MRVNILFRQGLIGDTIVAIPALHYLKKKQPSSRNIYVSIVQSENHYKPSQILDGSGLIDQFILIRKYSRLLYVKDLFSLYVLILQCQKFDSRVYILESDDFNNKRKAWIFRLMGIARVKYIDKSIDSNIVSQLLRLVGSISGDKDNGQYPKFLYSDITKDGFVRHWLERKKCRKLYALAINANFQSKKWKVQNYQDIARELYKKTGAKPVLMGGANDIESNQNFINELGFGYSVAGVFTLKHSIGIMKYMGFYLGNDTGVMHMAALSNIKCFAIFSGIEKKTKWFPYGAGHQVYLNKTICRGCLLRVCNQDGHLCMDGIDKKHVIKDIEFYINKELLWNLER